ncbi:deoxyribonuclease IV [Hydrogenibacillus sp. N12]|uniref:deoxyribonuclease IV n=1 Tax=Hydrogenibacillus sp. N12 TaxID=2866627 RepID=UPI00207BFBF6|nr:deoxyribonuclease IV [Hydrogenibacillus sp. N12]
MSHPLKIGSHVSFAKKGLLAAAEEAISYGSTTFMVYTGAPQNTVRRPMAEQFVDEGWALARAHGIDEIVVHAPYIINLASPNDDTFRLAVEFLQQEIERTAALGAREIVVHPGAYTDRDPAYGIRRIVEGLNEVLSVPGDVRIALETMAGKGTEVGRTFEEIAAIIDGVRHPERLSVCFDTCHVHDAGYDLVGDLDGVLEAFDRIIGLDRLSVVHLNDSKNPRGAAKDRHAPVGSGWIGYGAIEAVVRHPALAGRPFILETPWIGQDKKAQRPMYEVEIALLSGTLRRRFGVAFCDDVERLAAFFARQGFKPRETVLEFWTASRAKGADRREPMERFYALAREAGFGEGLSEEALNHRLIAYFATAARPLAALCEG